MAEINVFKSSYNIRCIFKVSLLVCKVTIPMKKPATCHIQPSILSYKHRKTVNHDIEKLGFIGMFTYYCNVQTPFVLI